MKQLPPNYCLRSGSVKDRKQLLRFLSLSYGERSSQQQDFSHLIQTVEQYLTNQTPLWWIDCVKVSQPQQKETVAGLWLGNATDQATGDYYAHIFLLYVCREHRRQGIATCLMQQAHTWAKNRGDSQIGLQVFVDNQEAIALYNRLGYQTQAISLLKQF